MAVERNELFDLAFRFITETREPVFLTGKAGTGKTTFLKYLREHTTKNMLVAAPTGVAAINAGGVTLHSLFQLPFHPSIPSAQGKTELLSKLRFGRQKQQLLRKVEVLVIDEISMVRCDVLDAIDAILRSVRREYAEPFGGVQLVCIGDLYQLPPVAQQQEWTLLQEYYNSPFFFDSHAVKEQQPLLIELNKIYRQKEETFVQLLNKVRNNEMDATDFELLHKRFVPGFQSSPEEQFITLTTHNYQADQINQRELNKLLAPAFTYNAEIEGEFPENSYPAEAALILKAGAQVMFLKNDSVERKYFNGKIGVITSLTDTSILVQCEDGAIEVRKEQWQNIRYSLNRTTQVLEEEVLGTFEQYPLRLAWAVTIHKSQGLTFDKVMIDAAAAFSSGQVYVALSRCTSLNGIVLLSRIPPTALISNQAVLDGQKKLEPRNSLAERFSGARQLFTQQLLEEVFGLNETDQLSARLLKQLQSNRSFLNADALDWLQNWRQEVATIRSIANKFLGLTQQLLKEESVAENNSVLQERITAAARHFLPLIQQAHKSLLQHPVATEHKEVSVPVDEMLQDLSLELVHTTYLLQYCSKSFDVPGFLRHKLQMPSPKQTVSCYASKRQTTEGSSVDHPELYQLLRHWRDAYCEEHNQPIYMVANGETLKQMAHYLPRTPEDLMKIKGVGEAKVKKWGAEILELVQDYCTEHDIAATEIPLLHGGKKEKKTAGKTKGPSTSEQTLLLLQEGKDIRAIAASRNLAISTIEGHILELVKAGKTDAGLFISETVLNKILHHMQANPESTLTETKERIEMDCSFFELRLAALIHQQQVTG